VWQHTGARARGGGGGLLKKEKGRVRGWAGPAGRPMPSGEGGRRLGPGERRWPNRGGGGSGLPKGQCPGHDMQP
jgi:hypothetical protein